MRPIRGRTLARARPGQKRSRIKLVPLSPASHYRSFSTAGYWTPQRATLRQRYRIVTYDQSGTGAERDVGRTCRGNQGATLHIAPGGAHALKGTEPEAFNSLQLDFRDRLQGVHGQDCRP